MLDSEKVSVNIQQNMERSRGWMIGLGVVFILLGLIGLGMDVGVTMASMVFIGVLLIAGGVVQLMDAFGCSGWKAVTWHILIGLLYLTAGGLIIYDPVFASAVITALIAWTLIFMGVARALMAFTLRHESGWGWLLLAGIAAFILGVLILSHWPSSAMWVIGMLISIEMIINGWMLLFMGMGMRKAVH